MELPAGVRRRVGQLLRLYEVGFAVMLLGAALETVLLPEASLKPGA